MSKTFAIDFFPSSLPRYRDGYAVVVIDVIRATTTAITAVASGRRCFVAGSLPQAYATAASVPHSLLVGELGGEMPQGFHMNNSPSQLARQRGDYRSVILLSSSGSKLMRAAECCEAAFLACFRNYSATADHLMRSGPSKVAIIGAGTGDEIREEDAICCVLIANKLKAAGMRSENEATDETLDRWSGATAEDCVVSNSVRFLRRTGQEEDLRFILRHLDDIKSAFTVRNGEVISTADLAWQVSAA